MPTVIVLGNLSLLVILYLVTQFLVIIPSSVLIIIVHGILLANYSVLAYYASNNLKRDEQAKRNIGFLSKLLVQHGRMGVFLTILGIAYMFIVAFLWNPDNVVDLNLLASSEGIQVLMQAMLVLSMPIWGLLLLARGENIRKLLYDLVYERCVQIFQDDPSTFPDFLKELYMRWQHHQFLTQFSSGQGAPGNVPPVFPRSIDSEASSRLFPSNHAPIQGDTETSLTRSNDGNFLASEDKDLEHYLEQFQELLRQYLPSLWECHSRGNIRLNLHDLFVYFVDRIFSDPTWLPRLKT